jgi:hypothetical protein
VDYTLHRPILKINHWNKRKIKHKNSLHKNAATVIIYETIKGKARQNKLMKNNNGTPVRGPAGSLDRAD